MKIFKMVVVSSTILIATSVILLTIGKKKIKTEKKAISNINIGNFSIKIPNGFNKIYTDNNTVQYCLDEDVLITFSIIDYKVAESDLFNAFYTLKETETKQYSNYLEKEFKALKYYPINECYFIGSSGTGYKNDIKHNIYMWNYVKLNDCILFINVMSKTKTKNIDLSDMVINVTYNGGNK